MRRIYNPSYRTMRLFAIPILIFLVACNENPDSSGPVRHLFYLHGRIIELQGTDAVSPEFGPYLFNAIIDSLKVTGNVLHFEVRNAQTDFDEFCRKTSAEIDQLISEGIAPGEITVIGASKGAVMAMAISDLNQNPVNYVLLGANNDYLEKTYSWNLHGRILGIYERSDSIAGKDYSFWIHASSNAKEFQELEINTGLGHGFLYRPRKAWLEPARNWMLIR